MISDMMEHRRRQAKDHELDPEVPFSSLLTVELNIADPCNRVCSFCPHGDPETYPNDLTKMMTLETATEIADGLRLVEYKGRVSLSGYGEPMMHRLVYPIVQVLRESLMFNNVIEMNTNGDALSIPRIQKLFHSGLSALYINMYDAPWQETFFRNMLREAGVEPEEFKLRKRWRGSKTTLTMNNRGGALDSEQDGHIPLEEPLGFPCWYPGFKMFVDWDGQVLGCSNDWRRTTTVGNVHSTSLDKIWLSEKMKEIRRQVFYGDRSGPMCRQCNVNGRMHSKASADLLAASYGWKPLESGSEK